MKHLKTFEGKGEIKFGDYVIVDPDPKARGLSDSWIEWFKTHIGRVSKVDSNRWNKIYRVDFKVATGDIETITFLREEIMDYSSDLEDLEYFIHGNKYNI